jgi:hypothetical protein
MNYPDISRDPPRDPEIAGWLSAAGIEDGAMEVDGVGLHAAIMERAKLPLARLRLQPQWWEYAARWALPAVPVAMAASIAIAFVVSALAPTGFGTLPDTAFVALPSIEDVITHPVPSEEYDLLVSSAGDTDALLSFTLRESR